MDTLKIAVASGKGGTGKTTVATNLAVSLADKGYSAYYVDCDVEEPNGHIFLPFEQLMVQDVNIMVPQVAEDKCTYCRQCQQGCNYSAIMVMGDSVLTFPKLCHGCGVCSYICPEHAIVEVPRTIGSIKHAQAEQLRTIQGLLTVGEALAPPVIRSLEQSVRQAVQQHKREHETAQVVVYDAPPGTSCPVVETIKKVDYVVLVTEPTPFGLNDLALAVDMARELGKPCGVIINRQGIGNDKVQRYCHEEDIPILLEIPNSFLVAQAYARGDLMVRVLTAYKDKLVHMTQRIEQQLSTAPRAEHARSDRASSQTTKAFDTKLADEAERPSRLLAKQVKHQAKELVVISGKGGTGKTSIVSSFASLAQNAVIADCDVDAADLHIILEPEIKKAWHFSGGVEAVIDPEQCTACGLCEEYCRFDAIRSAVEDDAPVYRVDPNSCEGCGLCEKVCNYNAIRMNASDDGYWFVSRTRHGELVHARLGVAAENSGKLVSLIREEARAIAADRKRELIIADGSPGIGCPVMASITNADFVLLVTEPSKSGMHDMKRVLELVEHFQLPAAVCINKADIDPELCQQIEMVAEKFQVPVVGKVGYNDCVTHAQIEHRSVVEYIDNETAQQIRQCWERVMAMLR